FEIGARGRIGQTTSWSAAVYRTTLDNDIEFIASNGAASNRGFFQNVGRTRRQGFELSGRSQLGPLAVTASYNNYTALYRPAWTENSAS
ncbi:TonB-dependent receptor domain-containing protein, partial [Paraburkholderia sp. SIMBA_054]|uniref:TonB-dependent receptor domain-containing protein n=1 Tax=Paraburkholderia sp. SIMBA_054 TaxID=3085795 RepID=UPI00397D09F3